MLRVDEKHWIKTGIEYVDGVQNLSAVVTHDYSDWSVIPLPNPPDVLHLRVERSKEAIQIFYLNEASNYAMLRMTYLPYETLQVGVMCASPDGDGFEVTFEDYQLILPMPKGEGILEESRFGYSKALSCRRYSLSLNFFKHCVYFFAFGVHH